MVGSGRYSAKQTRKRKPDSRQRSGRQRSKWQDKRPFAARRKIKSIGGINAEDLPQKRSEKEDDKEEVAKEYVPATLMKAMRDAKRLVVDIRKKKQYSEALDPCDYDKLCLAGEQLRQEADKIHETRPCREVREMLQSLCYEVDDLAGPVWVEQAQATPLPEDDEESDAPTKEMGCMLEQQLPAETVVSANMQLWMARRQEVLQGLRRTEEELRCQKIIDEVAGEMEAA